MARPKRLKLAVWKFTSCDGCQLSLLDCEDELLALAERVQIAQFRWRPPAPRSGSLRSVAGRGVDHYRRRRGADFARPPAQQKTGHDRRLRYSGRNPGAAQFQERSGIRRDRVRDSRIYLDSQYLDARSPTHVPVDFELRGCPINKHQLLEVIGAVHQRSHAGDSGASRMRGMQAARNRMRDGGKEDPVPGTDHARRMRRDLPRLRTRMLRMLRAERIAEYRIAGRRMDGGRRDPRPTCIGCCAPSTPTPASSAPPPKRSMKTIKVDYLARVEGEGALRIRFKGDQVRDVQLRIFEPPRFFEAFLRGRSYLEAPDITARICGICPVAYQMSSCAAMEDALGIEVGPAIARLAPADLLRRMDRKPRAAHVFASRAGFSRLSRRDRDGAANIATMVVARAGDQKGRQRHRCGVVGGREIHPVNPRVGGFHSLPPRDALRDLLPNLDRARASGT